MADDFEIPDAEEVEETGEEVEYEPPKEGSVQELVKGGGLKKLLVKLGDGWETPDTGDEVKGESRSRISGHFHKSLEVALQVEMSRR